MKKKIDGKPKTVTFNGNMNIQYSYDGISRVKSKLIDSKNAIDYRIDYEYVEGLAGATTTLVKSIRNAGEDLVSLI